MSLRANILASWIAHLVMIAIGFFMLPYVRNTLSPAAYGAWIFINMISGYAGLLYLGMGATTCRYVAKHFAKSEWEELNRVSSTTFLIYTGMAGLVMLLAGGFCLAAPMIPQLGSLTLGEVRAVILINGLATAIGMVGSVFGGILIGTQRVGLKRAIEVGSGILRFILAVTCLKLRPELTTLSVFFLVVTILENLLLWLFASRAVPELQIRRSLATRETAKECFSFSGYTAVGQAAEQIIYLSDITVIGFARGTSQVDIYNIGLRICQMIQDPLAKIGEVLLPKAGYLHAHSKHSELATLVGRMAALTFVLIGGFFIGAMYFGGMLIRTWIGEGLEQSQRILIILLAAQLVAQPMLILRKAMLGMGIVRVPALIDISEAVLNLILSIVLVMFWGIEGVAWGTFIPLVFVELLVFMPYACRQVNLRKRDLLTQSILPCLVPLAALWTYCEIVARQHYPDGWITLFAVTGGGGIALLLAGAPMLWVMQRNRNQPLPVTDFTAVGEAR